MQRGKKQKFNNFETCVSIDVKFSIDVMLLLLAQFIAFLLLAQHILNAHCKMNTICAY